MPTVAARLVAEIEADITGLNKGVQDAKKKLKEVEQATNDAGKAASTGFTSAWKTAQSFTASALSSIKSGLDRTTESLDKLSSSSGRAGIELTTAITAPLAGIAKLGLAFDDLKNRATIGFTTLLKSGSDAKKLIADIQTFAIKTPFEFSDTLGYTQRLKAMGEEAKNLIPDMKAVGDAVSSMGGGKDYVNRITYALGQMLATGHVTGHELRELAFAGINGMEALATSAGVSTSQMQEMISKGLVPAKWAVAALVYQMEQKAPDAMEKISHTLMAELSNLHDFAEQALGDLFKPLYDNLTNVLDDVQNRLMQFKDSMSGWSAETKNKIIAVFGSLASIGPLLLGFSGLAKAVSLLLSPMGLLAVAAGSVVYYLSQNTDEAKALFSAFSDAGPVLKDLLTQLDKFALTLGKQLTQDLKSLIPIVGELLGVLDRVLTFFNNLPQPVQNAIIQIGLLGMAFKALQVSGVLSIAQIALSFTSKLIPALMSTIAFWAEWTATFGIGSTLTTIIQTMATSIRVTLLGAWTQVGTYVTGTLIPAFMALSASVLVTTAAVLALVAAGYMAYQLAQNNIAENQAKERAIETSHPVLDRLMPQYNALQAQYGTETDAGKKTQIKAQMDDLWNQMRRSLTDSIGKAGSDLGTAIIKNATTGISTPAGEASCAYFASEVIKRAGGKLPNGQLIGSAQGLRDYLVKAGATAKPGQQALPGDVLIFHGKEYGASKDSQGMGYHAAIALGNGRYIQSSGTGGGTQRETYGQLHAGQAGAVSAFTVPDSLNLKRGNPAAPPPFKPDDAKEQQRLLDAYKQLAGQHEKNIALFGKESEVAKMRYDVEHGELAALSPVQKSYLIQLAAQEDILNAGKDRAKKFADALKQVGDSAKEQAQALALGANATQTQQLQYEFAHTKLEGLTEAQIKQIKSQQDSTVSMSRQREAMQALNGLRQEAITLSLNQEQRAVVEAVGGLAQYNQLTAQEKAEALELYRKNQLIQVNEEYTRAIANTTTETGLLNDAMTKAAITAAGGIDKWKLLTKEQQNNLRTVTSLQGGMTQLGNLSTDYATRTHDALSGVHTESASAEVSLQKIVKGLTEAAKADPGIQKLVLSIRDFAAQMDEAAASKLWSTMERGFDTQINELSAKIAGTYDAVTAAQMQWLQQNDDAIRQVEAIQGPLAAIDFLMEGIADSATVFSMGLQLQGIQKMNDLSGNLQRTVEEMQTNDPFQRWLVSLKEIDQITGQLKLPAGMDIGKLHGIFNNQQQINSQQKYNQMLGDLHKQALQLTAANPFDEWLASLMQVDQLTGELKLPDNLNKEQLKDIFNLKENIRIMQEFSDGVNNIFGQMFSDLREKGFGALFSSVYSGFQNLLYKMATEYLQSQLMQLFTRTLNGLFGMGNMLGSSSGSSSPWNETFPSGISGGIGGLLGGSIPFFGNGGFLPGGRAAYVGDRGTELIVPAHDSYVVPHNKLSGNDDSREVHYHFNYQINTNSPESFRTTQARTMSQAKAQADRQEKRLR